MGTVISKAADGVGALLGNAFVAPIKTIFGGSCEGVCSGTWDITCFIEHLCVSNLVKLLMVLGLCYITLMFFYLLFKVGICQCIGRSLCKMCWAACETYWFAFEDITCFLWHKLKNIKRVNHRRCRRLQDVEAGYSSSGKRKHSDDDQCLSAVRKSQLIRDRRKDRLLSSLYPSTRGSKDGQANRAHYHRHHHHHLKEMSQDLKNLRQLQMRKESNLRREAALFKRRLR